MTQEHPEQQYLDLISALLENGFYRPSPHLPLPSQPHPPATRSLMNRNMVFDLSQGYFPLMTVRRTYFKAIVLELLWFLSGSTNNHDLQATGAHFWDPWDTPDTNQAMGWSPGQLGPIYGHQWRHWGARMEKPDGTLDRPGYDQVAKLIETIKSTPHSKRLMVSSYNPEDAEDCFVTTCHGTFFCQVWGDRLHLHMVQRSGDVPVGIPFNIASYALLLMMLAQVTGLNPGTFHHTISDAHVYENQEEAMRVLLQRKPLPYPQLIINPAVRKIEDFTVDDLQIVDYQFHPALEVPVAT